MKVAIDLTPLADHLSGIERYAASISKELVGLDCKGINWTLIFKGAAPALFYDAEKLPNVTLEILPEGDGGKLLFAQWILPRYLNRNDFDLVLFLAFPSPVFFNGRSISAVHDLCCFDCPETMTLRSKLYWRALIKTASKRSDPLLTVSSFSRSRLMDHFKLNEKRVVVIHNGIDRDLFNSERSQHADLIRVREKYGLPDRFVLSLSTIEPRKRLDLLIEAWQKAVLDHGFGFDLVLAGRKGWKTEQIMSGIDPELSRRISFTGFIDDEDLPLVYSLSSLFVFPSQYEGFGLPPLEALCSGAKVLCSDIESLKEVGGDNFKYFKSGSVDDLAKALMVYCNNESVHSPLAGQVGFSWGGEAEKLLDVITGMEIV